MLLLKLTHVIPISRITHTQTPDHKAYTMVVPKFEKQPFPRNLDEKYTPFSTEVADFEAQ